MKELINYLVTPLLNFVKGNYVEIITVVILISFVSFMFYITTFSLGKLKTDIFSGYPFDTFFPKSGGWSVGYFLILIILLGLLLFFLTKGEFYLSPA